MHKIENKKELVILMHNGGRLGNQLWLMASVYAFCIEKNYDFDMRCFFEYQDFFEFKSKSLCSNFINKIYRFSVQRLKIPESIVRMISYEIYTIWIDLFSYINKNKIIFDAEQIPQKKIKIFLYKRYKFLMNISRDILRRILKQKEKYKTAFGLKNTRKIIIMSEKLFTCRHTYLYGWLFRDPINLIRHQKEISNFLRPKKDIVAKIENIVKQIKTQYKTIIGVHIRKGDCINEYINGEKVSFGEQEILNILLEYLEVFKLKTEETCFVICSDEKTNLQVFSKINVKTFSNNAIEDLWLLSKTDTIIGTDSSFTACASYFGNIPLIIFQRGKIDWNYYIDKKDFFVNKHAERFIY